MIRLSKLTCYQCQPENLVPGAELYETGWEESASEGWFVVMSVAMVSPVLSWMILPFLRGEGSKETNYDILICGPARWLGLCGQGGPSSLNLPLNPAAVAELSDTLTSGEGGEGGGDWVGPPPIEPSKGPEGPSTV
eukprot:COSAG02_NODE_2949_length_7680_cov_4.274238_6_plen_136_part_00